MIKSLSKINFFYFYLLSTLSYLVINTKNHSEDSIFLITLISSITIGILFILISVLSLIPYVTKILINKFVIGLVTGYIILDMTTNSNSYLESIINTICFLIIYYSLLIVPIKKELTFTTKKIEQDISLNEEYTISNDKFKLNKIID